MMLKKIIVLLIIVISLGFMAFVTQESCYETKNIYVETDYESIVVLELFTSQGCSSCPAADVLLDEIKNSNQKNFYVMSYHVDYWNYLGWKDPFSKKAYKEKQSIYNSKFKYRGNYTPEVVVNGKTHFVGSSKYKMFNTIEEYKKKRSSNKIEISELVVNDNKLKFNYAISGGIKEKAIRSVLVLDEKVTMVTRGENKSRTLKNSNIVVAEETLDLHKNTGIQEIVIPKEVSIKDSLSLILLVENKVFDITGAVQQALAR
ncbi:DUF1223 domain-containing protein [uncultured Maribacter sp.]|uniref:DUF1223 domain-containing protein n=1 Tax=uncultured Maribacter sp. TaxID=431308 RepID=UPI0026055D81|nr:DUF1223 domain-containing protein [uncultured Maribacter sp.]